MSSGLQVLRDAIYVGDRLLYNTYIVPKKKCLECNSNSGTSRT